MKLNLQDFEELKESIKKSKNVFIFDSKEALNNEELMSLLKDKNIINFSSKSDELITLSKITVSILSFSKKFGTIIN